MNRFKELRELTFRIPKLSATIIGISLCVAFSCIKWMSWTHVNDTFSIDLECWQVHVEKNRFSYSTRCTFHSRIRNCSSEIAKNCHHLLFSSFKVLFFNRKLADTKIRSKNYLCSATSRMSEFSFLLCNERKQLAALALKRRKKTWTIDSFSMMMQKRCSNKNGMI